ncbi:unnamed protein product [Orchesella dallaii]|uniref:Gustatory receptor n=1 Tax=Orchesella dallaii TaxID=48710 RepID=A0ABP1PRA1_9HEXA
MYPVSSQYSLTERIMAEAVVLVTVIFDIYFRFNFYRLSTRLVELLKALEYPKYKPLNALFRKCWKSHKISLWILAVPRYMLAFTIVCAYAAMTVSYPDSAFFIPRYWYFVLFTMFTAVPHVTSVIFAYDLIVITTFHMLWTFEDYCAHLEDHIYKGYFLRKRLSLNPTPSLRSLQIPVGDQQDGYLHQKQRKTSAKRFSLATPNEFRNLKRLSDAEEGKGFEKMSFNCFVERFDWIRGLTEKYDRVMGPIILGVVVRCVFSIVHSVNSIMLKSGEQVFLKTWYHVLLLLVEASQLVILKLGSEVHERIAYWKGKLTKAWLLTTSGGYNMLNGANRLNQTLDSEDLTLFMDDVEHDNQLVQDLVNYVCTWDWKVSAGGIFDVDKSLMSGIVSTTLTYVVILFQLNLAEQSSLNCQCAGIGLQSDSSAVFDYSSNSTL